MSEHYPKARVPTSHYFLTFSHGDTMRTFALRPWALYALVGILPVICTWYLGATLYLVFKDDMLAALMSRQADVQYAYEDRISAMRAEIDRVTSKQLLNQDSFEGKVHELASRQAQLESRAAIVTSLADLAGGMDVTGSIAQTNVPAVQKAPAGTTRANQPVEAIGYAPVLAPLAFPPLTSSKPHPESAETLPTSQRNSQLQGAPDMPIAKRLATIGQSLDDIESRQVRNLAMLEAPARTRADRLRNALNGAGLSPDKMRVPGQSDAMGGPFVPLKLDTSGSPFEREVARLQTTVLALDKLRHLVGYIPLRQPLPGHLEVTSAYGPRADPFFGRTAMHSGIDFRDDYGSPIRATAAGKVAVASMSGGYGNLVEIDHGNGLSTRYGHMSAILVVEGQKVKAGQIIGRLGSTGRSTGPHLHYETRIDGEAVDPKRFLHAGAGLFATN